MMALMFGMLSLFSPAASPDSPQCATSPLDVKYEILGSFRRSATAFTEGLVFDEGKLIESTGRYRDAPVTLNSIDPETGKVRVLRSPPKWNGKTIFGEGLARLSDRYYQLTYDSGVAFVYTAKSWKLVGTIAMPAQLREGWGLTPYGSNLVMSNGTSSLFILDPVSMKLLKEIPIRDSSGQSYRSLNMLQSVGDRVYSNVFLTDLILEIDLTTGCVLGQLDMSPLWLELSDQELQMIRSDARENVLNGIAYDPATETFFVTGKNWPRIFRIKIRR